ncbi:MAG TPA: ATPase domain-containing protein, partial [Acidimicrobiales bacterium]|nr:ATPase domain-containing protein [Acidimicrobiales bacterium]
MSRAPRTRIVHRCTECGAEAPRWSGRCPVCSAWNCLVEEIQELAVAPTAGAAAPVVHGTDPASWSAPRPLSDVDLATGQAKPTGLDELDRVLAGGLVPGSVTLVGGEPGIGKSTLVMQALGSLARSGARCLLVSAEESAQQVRLRSDRLAVLEPDLWLFSTSSLPAVLAAVGELEPDVLVVDSVQTIAEPALGSAPGTVAQVRECARQLTAMAKQ